MNEKWESDSLRWIHSLRKQNYQRTKKKPLRELPLGPSAEAKALVKKLGLQRASLRTEKRPETRNKATS